jgi:hypothetical protein
MRSEELRESQATVADTTSKTPNFIIIGAAKSGTTSLYHYLAQHPQIYMSPRKHTRFFAYENENPSFRGPGPVEPPMPYAIADVESYHALFDGASHETALGEASHSYLYQAQAAGRIKKYAPGMKLIAILRDPTERAFSHYRQLIRNGRERITDFTEALEKEEARVRDNWWPDFHYVRIGLYYQQLQRYLELFGHEQIKVYLYEDLCLDPTGMLCDVFRFLDVDDSFIPQANVRYNASGIPKNRSVHAVLQRLRRVEPFAARVFSEGQMRLFLRIGSNLHNRNLSSHRLSPQLRAKVTEAYFREDILRLQDLIQRDLSTWLR